VRPPRANRVDREPVMSHFSVRHVAGAHYELFTKSAISKVGW
jgi:hypothetical protein